MAWPCITRACCINRFWSELDKADIAVPLVFTKYSDVAEVQHVHPQRQPRDRSVAVETQPPASEQESAGKTAQLASAALGDEGSSSSVMRQDFKAWKVRPERSCKPRNQYHPSEAPFNNETQYRKDYKPWPIPRKGDHPWIPKASPTKSAADSAAPSTKEMAVAEVETGVEKCEIEEKQQEKETKDTKEREKKGLKEKEVEKSQSSKMEQEEAPDGKGPEGKGRAAADALNRQIKQDATSGSSYRTEFKAYTDVKPVRPIRAKSQYKLPTTDKASLETSYSATFRGEQGAPQDNKQLDRRRIRSLYSEPRKDSSKVEKPGAPQPRARRSTTTSSGKQVRKSKDKQKQKEKEKEKEKQSIGGQPARKKNSVSSLQSDPADIAAAAAVSKQSKEMINRLAEGKE